MPFGSGRVHADPKTASQLRAALGSLQNSSDEVIADLDELEAQVGPVSATFTSTAAAGQPVYVSAADTVDLADASAAATAGVVGLVYTAASAGNGGDYITSGRITQDDWTTATGAANLTAGMVYYLSETTGRITSTAPTAVGALVVRVGRALNTTTLEVSIEPGILL